MKGLIFTYALTYGGAAVSLFRPFYGFLIYVAFANLKPEALWGFSLGAGGNYSKIVALAFLAGWLIHGAGTWNFGRAKSMIYSLLFFWAWMLLSAFITPAQDTAWKQLESLSKVYLPVIAGITLIDSTAKLKQLAWVLVATQGYLAFEFNLTYYTHGINTGDWKFAEMDNNTIAITMVTACGLAFFMGMHADRWWQKLAAFAAAALMAHVVLFSLSRGGMLALCITGAIAFWLIPKRPVHFALLAAAVAIVLRLAGPQVQEEFFSSFKDKEALDYSAQSRFDLTRDALTVMAREPIFGCGLQNWGNVAPQFGWPRGKEAHNLWAQTGAELGVPGLVGLLGFYLFGCWKLLKVAREKTPVDDPWLKYFARMVIASIAGFIVSAAMVTVVGIELPYYAMVLGAGTLKLYSLSSIRAPLPSLAAHDPVPAAAV